MKTRLKRAIRGVSEVAALLMLLQGLAAGPVWGQSPSGPPPAGEPNATELAKQIQNPIASLISVPFQGNWDFGIGDRKATGTLLNFQPVVPFPINESTNVILRVIMPLTSRPSADGTTGYSGLGDVVMSVFFSPSESGRLIWGVGPVFLLPTATDKALGAEKIGMGPTVVALAQPGRWTVGALANQLWSVDGAKDRPAVNTLYLQPFLNYNLGKGLAIGTNMEATNNWKAKERWSAPLLFTVSKVAMLGKRPVNILLGAGPYVAGPAGAPSWRFRLAATFLYPR